MYSNMEINDTIKTVHSYITKITGIDKIRFNLELLIKLLKIFLTTNLLMFGDLHFQQTKSIAMGTSCAVTIANIYVAYNEETKIFPKFVEKQEIPNKTIINN